MCLIFLSQDVINAAHEHKSLKEKVSIASALLDSAYPHLFNHTGRVTFEYLEAVAHTRYGLLIAGEVLHEDTCNDAPTNPIFLAAVQNVCSSKHINRINEKLAIGPNVFLLKVLGRIYSMSSLKKVAKKHNWLLPQLLRNEVCILYTYAR